MPDSARFHLRNATRAQHAALDGSMADLDLSRRDHYARFLSINAAVAPLELALEAAGVALDLPDWPHRRRRDALWMDMRDIGVPIESYELPAVDLASQPARLGLLYVLEGSRLGASVLRRAVAASPDASVRQAMRFIDHGEGADLWRTFLPQMENGLASHDQRARAAATAALGFDRFLARAPLVEVGA